MRRLEKNYQINANAESFYEAMTSETAVSQWSGAPAKISEEEGSAFSLWGGSIIGKNAIVSTDKIIQLWKEKSWVEYSNVTFEWQQDAQGLEVTLTHTGIPEGSFQNIKRGWDEHYMNPLITWLESNNL